MNLSQRVTQIIVSRSFLIFLFTSLLTNVGLCQEVTCECLTDCNNLVPNGGFEGQLGVQSQQQEADVECWEITNATPHIYDRDNGPGVWGIPGLVIGMGDTLFNVETWDWLIENNQILCVQGTEIISSELTSPIADNTTFELSFYALNAMDILPSTVRIGLAPSDLGTGNIWSDPDIEINSFPLDYLGFDINGYNIWEYVSVEITNTSGEALTHIYIGTNATSMGSLLFIDDVKIVPVPYEAIALDTISLNVALTNDTISICPNQMDSLELFPDPPLECPVFWTSNNTVISTDSTITLLPDTTTTYTVHGYGCTAAYTFTIEVYPILNNDSLFADSLTFQCPYQTINLMSFFSGDSADFYLDSFDNLLVDDSLNIGEIDSLNHILYVVFDDVHGCPDTLWRAFQLPIYVDSISHSPYLCEYQDCVGHADVSVTSLNPPYSFYWNGADTPITSSSYDSLCVGLNTLLVVDSLGCTYQTTFELDSIGCNWSVEYTVTDSILSCYGDMTTIGFSIIGGDAPITIICDSDTICSLVALPALYVLTNVTGGYHHVEIRDSLCCFWEHTFYIQPAPDSLELLVDSLSSSCFDGCSGAIDISISGGVAPYEYLWSDGTSIISNEQGIDSLCAGSYSVLVTDSNNCALIGGPFEINEICCAEINIVLDSTITACPGVAEAAGFITITGGAGSYTVTWEGPVTSDDEDPMNLIPGEYEVTAIDTNGCDTTVTLVIPTIPFAADPLSAGFVLPAGTTYWDNTTWGTTTVNFDTDITVSAGATLDITGLMMNFTPGHGIRVAPDGILSVHGCRMDVVCGLYWDGIRVEAFEDSDSTMVRGQMLADECVFTHALVAAANHQILLASGSNPFINVSADSAGFSTAGGYIKALDCDFEDNKRDIDLRKEEGHPVNSEESYFGNCFFRLTTDSLPVTPVATEFSVRVFLFRITNVLFSDCHLVNDIPAYLNINSSSDNDHFIGLQANFSAFHWHGDEEETGSPVSRVLHFRKGMRVSGRFTGNGTNALVKTDIRNTIFNNLISIHGVSETEIFIYQNSFTNLNGTTFDPPGYPSNSSRPIGIWMEGNSSNGSSFDIVQNNLQFNDVPGVTYNEATAIKADNTRGVQANLIYRNVVTGCDRYGFHFTGRNRSDSTNVTYGLHYECNIFGIANNQAAANRYDVYVEMSQGAGYGAGTIQYNSNENTFNQSAGNTFQDTDVNSNCDDIDYSAIPNQTTSIQVYRVYDPTELFGVGEICDLVVIDSAAGTQPNNCALFEAFEFTGSEESLMLEELYDLEALRGIYYELIDSGNTELLLQQVQNTSLGESDQLAEELMSLSPNLSDEVLIEAIQHESDFPDDLLTSILAVNPSATRSDIVLEALNERELPLTEEQMQQVLNAGTTDEQRKMLEQEMTYHTSNLHYYLEKQLDYMRYSGDELFTENDYLELFHEYMFREDLVRKSVMMRTFGDWTGGIALLQQLPEIYLMTSSDREELNNEIALLQLESDIRNEPHGIPDMEQIELLENWHLDYHDLTCKRAAEILFLLTGRIVDSDCMDGEASERSMSIKPAEAGKGRVAVYPNPASESCTLDLTTFRGNSCSVDVFDATGRRVAYIVTKDGELQVLLSLSALESGLYSIVLTCSTMNDKEVVTLIKD